MNSTPTIITIKTVDHNGITISRTNVCTNSQALKHDNPMMWVYVDNGSSLPFKTLKAAKEAIDRKEMRVFTDMNCGYFMYAIVDGQFDTVVITEQEWRARRDAARISK